MRVLATMLLILGSLVPAGPARAEVYTCTVPPGMVHTAARLNPACPDGVEKLAQNPYHGLWSCVVPPNFIAVRTIHGPECVTGPWYLLYKTELSGDFTGDTHADLVMLRNHGPGSAHLMVLRGTTARDEYTTAPYPVWEGTWGTTKLASGDFTGEGKSDVLALTDVGGSTAELHVFPGSDRTGQLASPPYRVWASAAGAWNVNSSLVGSGDFTGDCRADLLAMVDLGGASAGLYVFPGTAGQSATATAPYRVWHTGPGTWSVASSKIAVGDFTGDGKTDVISLFNLGNNSAGLYVFPGTSARGDTATTPYRAWFTGPGTWSVASTLVGAGDFTGDGKADLVGLVNLGNNNAGLYVFPGTSARGDAATAPRRTWLSPPGTWNVADSKIVVGDFTGDGKADLQALYDYGNSSAGVWVFPGTPVAGDAATAPYRVWWVTPGVFDAKVTQVAP